MKRIFERDGSKVVVAFFLIFVGVTAILSASFAGLSATILFDAGDAEVGVFDFKNNTYSLDLFPTNYIYPGDGGSAVFSLPNFAGYTPIWTMKEVNENTIPVVFYIGDAYYSKYSFDTSLYFKNKDNEYISCADISEDNAVIISNVEDGATIKWIWPETLYELNGEEYIESTGTVATEYMDYNESLCSCTYSFDASLATAMSEVTVGSTPHAPKAYIISDVTEETQLAHYITDSISATNKITCIDGIYYINGEAVTLIQNGVAVTPTASTAISKDDYYSFLVTDNVGLTITEFINGVGEEYKDALRVSEEKYDLIPHSDTTYTLSATTDDLRFRIVKVYPTATATTRASISLSFSATVSTD